MTMNNFRNILAMIFAFSPLTLSGCIEAGARLVGEATYLADSASAYVREVHDLRRWIREQCFELLKTEIRVLGDDTTKIRDLLRASYPSLVTVEIVRDVKDEPRSVLSVPAGCADSVDLIGPGE
jgi:hypothetical protein